MVFWFGEKNVVNLVLRRGPQECDNANNLIWLLLYFVVYRFIVAGYGYFPGKLQVLLLYKTPALSFVYLIRYTCLIVVNLTFTASLQSMQPLFLYSYIVVQLAARKRTPVLPPDSIWNCIIFAGDELGRILHSVAFIL